jgi:DNA repair protein RadC
MQQLQKFNLIMEKSKDYNIFNDMKVTSSALDAYNLAKTFRLDQQAEEVFAVAGFDAQGAPISYFEVHRGGLDNSLVSPREIFKRLMLSNARAFIAFHNHPSGLATPSPADEDMTKELASLGRKLYLDMLDHIIIGDNVYYSFAEHNKL